MWGGGKKPSNGKAPEKQETEVEQVETEETEEDDEVELVFGQFDEDETGESIDDTEAEGTKEDEDVERLTVDDILDEFGYSDLEGLYSGVPQSDIDNCIIDWLMDEGSYERPHTALCNFNGMDLPAVYSAIKVEEINAVGNIYIAIEPDHGDTFLISTDLYLENGSAFIYDREVNELPTYEDSVNDVIDKYYNR